MRSDIEANWTEQLDLKPIKVIMKSISLLIFLLLIISCNNKATHKEEASDIVHDISTNYTEYAIFHDKLKVLSPVKPFEEDATNTVSKLALTLYSDIKKYSLINVFDSGGIIGITVAEFKEADTSFSEQNYFDELLAIYKNNANFKVVFDTTSTIKHDNFNGFKTKAQLYTSGKESSMMYMNLMSDKKLLITSVGIYDKDGDRNIFEKIVSSIKINSNTSN